MIEVAVPDKSILVLPLHRLTVLNNGFDNMEDDSNEVMEGDDDQETTTHQGNLDMRFTDGEWQVFSTEQEDENGDWVDEQSDDSMDVDETSSEQGSSSPQATVNGSSPIKDVTQTDSQGASIANSRTGTPVPTPQSEVGDISWKRFDILPTPPPDHAFLTVVPTQPSKAFMTRLYKEYRVLASSLPGELPNLIIKQIVPYLFINFIDTIIVRAYEDRADLMRCMIIGPENTPYEDAPFVIDWLLDSKFPQSPPVAHFLSWTNGNGRGEQVT